MNPIDAALRKISTDAETYTRTRRPLVNAMREQLHRQSVIDGMIKGDKNYGR